MKVRVSTFWLFPTVRGATVLVTSGCNKYGADTISTMDRKVVWSKGPTVQATGPLKVPPTGLLPVSKTLS